MSPAAIEAWAKDPRAREASFESTRRRLPRLAELKRKKCSRWTSRDQKLAKRALSFNARMEGVVNEHGCSRKAVIALRNWGRQPKKCGVPPKMKKKGKLAELQLSDGRWTKVDLRDAQRIHFPLRTTEGYATYQDGRKTRLLHRELKGGDALSGLYVDHQNRDRLDNRRDNLRVVTGTENNLNRGGVFARKSRR
jgi:hypothetical protein